jgi:NADPH-dependent stearoyl-CoA 9-desaturase
VHQYLLTLRTIHKLAHRDGLLGATCDDTPETASERRCGPVHAASTVIPPFVSVREQLPVDLHHGEKERRADAEQQYAVHRF